MRRNRLCAVLILLSLFISLWSSAFAITEKDAKAVPVVKVSAPDIDFANSGVFTIESTLPGFMTININDANGSRVISVCDHQEAHSKANDITINMFADTGLPLLPASYFIVVDFVSQMGVQAKTVSTDFVVANPPLTTAQEEMVKKGQATEEQFAYQVIQETMAQYSAVAAQNAAIAAQNAAATASYGTAGYDTTGMGSTMGTATGYDATGMGSGMGTSTGYDSTATLGSTLGGSTGYDSSASLGSTLGGTATLGSTLGGTTGYDSSASLGSTLGGTATLGSTLGGTTGYDSTATLGSTLGGSTGYGTTGYDSTATLGSSLGGTTGYGTTSTLGGTTGYGTTSTLGGTTGYGATGYGTTGYGTTGGTATLGSGLATGGTATLGTGLAGGGTATLGTGLATGGTATLGSSLPTANMAGGTALGAGGTALGTALPTQTQVVTYTVAGALPLGEEGYQIGAGPTDIYPQTNKNYWNLSNLSTDADIWAAMIAPIKVLDMNETEIGYIYNSPNEGRTKIGSIGGLSQGLNVLMDRTDGWSLVEAYRTEDGAFVRGYVKTNKIKSVEVNTIYGLIIDKVSQMMVVYMNGQRIGSCSVSTGVPSPDHLNRETPAGEYITVTRRGTVEYPSKKGWCKYSIRINGNYSLCEIPSTKKNGTDFTAMEATLGQKASRGSILLPHRASTDGGINAEWVWKMTDTNKKVRIMIINDQPRNVLAH